ncbi:MAG: hypothetical protein COU08_00515 [Candidatus Harrisonbacteria bacterium CG10_big_fil_rev_8_21_14_0_10_42_17]|uniref:Uncharacterized protein n=1 Tax=Candidatus Harrisonbacteria bacterium CG10_big_fil_rev_8_21_14_0_10_42_17 TaxID=1974584 RepID=A0A2M6WJ27_9BACT|nr:MAG: hypothetical protein COU08_00515 [Candidatus Harrisonbacteria bacterium CG10_big_fil_rev_8_21_14_0_10_42_17]
MKEKIFLFGLVFVFGLGIFFHFTPPRYEVTSDIPFEANLLPSPPLQESPPEPVLVDVIFYNDMHYIPVSELRVVDHIDGDVEGVGCSGAYWRPRGVLAQALDGMLFSDPDPERCGFGMVTDVPVRTIDPTLAQ